MVNQAGDTVFLLADYVALKSQGTLESGDQLAVYPNQFGRGPSNPAVGNPAVLVADNLAQAGVSESEVGDWSYELTSNDGSPDSSGFTVQVGGDPVVEIFHDGGASNDTFCNAWADDDLFAPVTITWDGVTATTNSIENNLFIGFTDTQEERQATVDNAVFYSYREGGGEEFIVSEGGNQSKTGITVDWGNDPHTLEFELTGSDAIFRLNGSKIASLPFSYDQALYANTTREDDTDTSASEDLVVDSFSATQ